MDPPKRGQKVTFFGSKNGSKSAFFGGGLESTPKRGPKVPFWALFWGGVPLGGSNFNCLAKTGQKWTQNGSKIVGFWVEKGGFLGPRGRRPPLCASRGPKIDYKLPVKKWPKGHFGPKKGLFWQFWGSRGGVQGGVRRRSKKGPKTTSYGGVPKMDPMEGGN